MSQVTKDQVERTRRISKKEKSHGRDLTAKHLRTSASVCA